MTGAILIYLIATGVVLVLELWLERVSEGTSADWLVAQVVVPALRILTIIIFLAAAHPLIYGLDDAPSIRDILFGREGRLDLIVNIVFLSTLALPMVPVIGKHESLILPIQAIVAATVIFHWTALGMGLRVSLFPGMPVVISVLAIAVAGDLVGRLVRDRLLRGEPGYVRYTLFDASILLFQLPAVIVYTRGLGAQLS